MNTPAIRVEHLSKRFQIGAREAAQRTFREAIMDAVAAPIHRLRRLRGATPEDDTIWALRDVSFEVQPGEVLGIIGRNGAGKSTLLKILSRITQPTEGRVEIRGRVASLLEVGTGFHSELTGRENIYLNGAILGMSRREIVRKFDEIVDFAEVERFIDTPVKRYSSGMYLRLAFAVAAHLEPEILIVDEVLAVGDAAFQQKCLGKMGDVAHEGRTVLLVSHNMRAVQLLCRRAALIEAGHLLADGSAPETVRSYLRAEKASSAVSPVDLSTAPRDRGMSVVIHSVQLLSRGRPTRVLMMGDPITIVVHLASLLPIDGIRFGVSIDNSDGQRVVSLCPNYQAPDVLPRLVDGCAITCTIPEIHLMPGTYYLTMIAGSSVADLDRVDRALEFTVNISDVYGTGVPPRDRDGIYYERPVWAVAR